MVGAGGGLNAGALQSGRWSEAPKVLRRRVTTQGTAPAGQARFAPRCKAEVFWGVAPFQPEVLHVRIVD